MKWRVVLSSVVVVCAACSSAQARDPGTVATRPTTAIARTQAPPTSASAPATALPAAVPPAVALLAEGAAQPWSGEDRIEVWLCRVPADTRFEAYLGLDYRLDATPQNLVDMMTPYVAQYYEQLSNGRYEPRLRAGGVVVMTADETPNTCVDDALDRSSPGTAAVLAIADAEHVPTSPGGWGRPAAPGTCPTGQLCPAAVSRRAAYIGGSDFHPSWGDRHPMDLVEHELGHTLNWPHSGGAESLGSGADAHESAIDLMSNSAARREADAAASDGQGAIVANLIAAGWIPLEDVAVVPPAGGEFELAPTASSSGVRALAIPLDEWRLVTVEFRPATGLDSFLPDGGGVAVHLVDQSPAACRRAAGDTSACTGIAAGHVALVGAAPFTDLLQAGERWMGEGWSVAVTALSPSTVALDVRPEATGG